MTPGQDPPGSIVVAVGLFRRLTRLMPREYRHRYRDEAVDLMARLAVDAHRHRGALGVLAVAARTMLDFIVRLPVEHAGLVRVGSRPRRSASVTLRTRARIRASLDALRRDALYSFRSLRRAPLSNTAAIATLAIGIGLNAAVFLRANPAATLRGE